MCSKIQTFSYAQVFQNNILKADLVKNSLGAVKLTIYTSKPYHDSLIVNKKNDFEYVVLMPETSNSIVAKPSLASVSDSVRYIDIKTQQYQDNIKGYTKITILTTKPIELSPRAEVINTTKYIINDNDYKELLAQAPKKNVVNNNVSKKQSTNLQTALPKKTVTAVSSPVLLKTKQSLPKIESKALPVKSPGVIVKKHVQQNTTTKQPVQVIKKSNIIKQNKPAVLKPAVVSKAIAPPVVKKQEPKKLAQTQTKPQVKAALQAPLVSQNIPKTVSSTADSVLKTVSNTTPITESNVVSLSPVETAKNVLLNKNPYINKIINVVKDNLFSVICLSLAAFLLLLLLVRRATKGHIRQKEIFAQNLKDQPTPSVDYSQNITEDMSWKEKFQTYVETSNQVADKTVDEGFILQDDSPNLQSEDAAFNDGLDALFSKDDLQSSAVSQEQISETGLLEEEYYNPSQKFPEPSMQDIDDEAQVNNESLGSNLSDYEVPSFDINNGVNDLDTLFDEEEVSSNAALNSAFDAQDLIMNEIQDGDSNLKDNDLQTEASFDEEIYAQNEYLSDLDELIDEGSDVEEQAGAEYIKDEYSIDQAKGFYLVDFEDTSALVGHINDEIFVLKRFEEKINAPLQARLDEVEGNSSKYMTKVGSFRGLVEVTQNKMNLLIEL